MAGYDLAAMRAQLRFLIRDPNGDAITNNDVRDFYINPAYRDWWRRYEERPGALAVAGSINAGDRSVPVTLSQIKFNDVVYRVNMVDPVGGTLEFSTRRSEYNRVRYLQETEGRGGLPGQWGFNNAAAGGSPAQEIAFYPLADQTYAFNVYCKPALTALAGDATNTVLDPVSARYVTRIAAYRAGLDLKIPMQTLQACALPLPGWVKSHFNMAWLFESKSSDQRDAYGYARVVEPAHG